MHLQIFIALFVAFFFFFCLFFFFVDSIAEKSAFVKGGPCIKRCNGVEKTKGSSYFLESETKESDQMEGENGVGQNNLRTVALS